MLDMAVVHVVFYFRDCCNNYCARTILLCVRLISCFVTFGVWCTVICCDQFGAGRWACVDLYGFLKIL